MILLGIGHIPAGVLLGAVAGVGYTILRQRVGGKVLRNPVSLQAVLSHHDLEPSRHPSRVHAGAGEYVHANPVSFLFMSPAISQHILHCQCLSACDGCYADIRLGNR